MAVELPACGFEIVVRLLACEFEEGYSSMVAGLVGDSSRLLALVLSDVVVGY